MGNTVSTDYEECDIWWATSHTTTEQTKQTSTREEYDLVVNEELSSSETNINNVVQTYNSQPNTQQAEIAIEEKDKIPRQGNEEKLQQFRSDLEKKHLARREAIAERSREILFLRGELVKYKKENQNLIELLKSKNNKDECTNPNNENKYISKEDKNQIQLLAKKNSELQDEIQELKTDLKKSEELIKQNTELRIDISTAQKELQSLNAQMLEFEKERNDYKTHVIALKDVIHVSKKLLEIRENQLKELKSKIADIETSLAEHEASMLSTNLKNEYERQLRNMRALRTLYEQRQAATKAEKDLVASQLSDIKKVLEDEQKKNSELQERIDELESNVSEKYDKIANLESQLGLAKAEYRGLEAEMSVINQLFSQILLSFNNCQGIDLDKLIKLLEENHDLLTNIVINEESEAVSSALPKVLLDLINRVNSENQNSENDPSENQCAESELPTTAVNGDNSGYLPTIPEECLQAEQQSNNQMNSAEEIVNKLPKVWRVLTELLRQQSGLQQVNINENDADPCYKSVETPKGPKLVLSVSKTFIRLKDLILEKKSLEKEMTRLKQLNTHLEGRLQDQEKRLELVSTELSKTWHVVGRMQRQHQQLHTHEKILRYELAQKRKMLTELKDELEYCREKWEQAREKNSTTEEEWRKLRLEFASRKTTVADELNNSAESGYSDERECSSDEDSSFCLDDKNEHMTNKSPPIRNKPNTNLSDSEDNDLILDTKNNNDSINLQSELKNNEVIHNNEKKITEISPVNNETEAASLPGNVDPVQNVNYDSRNIIAQYVESTTSNSVLSISPQENVLKLECDKKNTHSNNNQKTDSAVQIQIETKTNVQNNTSVETDDLNCVASETDTSNAASFSNMTNTPASNTQPLSNAANGSTHDEMLARKEERLKRLEEQCKQLVTKVTNTSNRSTEICNKLETLHEQYGNDERETK